MVPERIVIEEEPIVKVVTGKVRLGSAYVFRPVVIPKTVAPMRYKARLLIPKNSKTVTDIKQAIDEIYNAKRKMLARLYITRQDLLLCLRDGDEELSFDKEVYQGNYFINACSSNKPGIVDLHLNEITEPEKLYPGCYVRVSLHLFLTFAWRPIISFSLGNIQKLSDGHALKETCKTVLCDALVFD